MLKRNSINVQSFKHYKFGAYQLNFLNTSLTVFTVSKLILSTPANGGLKFIFSTFFLCSFIHLMTTFLIFRVTLWKPLRIALKHWRT